MAWYDNFLSFVNPSADPASGQDPAPSPEAQNNTIEGYKTQAIALARDAAQQRLLEYAQQQGIKPENLNYEQSQQHGSITLVDYYRACVKIGQDNHLPAKDWNPQMFADLSQQDVNGFLLNDPRKGPPDIDKNYDGYDLDGDGKINMAAVDEFYDHIKFNGPGSDPAQNKGVIRNSIIDPAQSFALPIADAKKIENVTFNNMTKDDVFVLGSNAEHKDIKNIKLTNFTNGTIVINSQADGLDIRGVQSALVIGANVAVNNIQVCDKTRIISLNMKDGAAITNSDLAEATISNTSHVQNATFQGVRFGGNLPHIDMTGAKLTNVTFENANVQNLTLRNAELVQVQINAEQKNAAYLKELDLRGAKKIENLTINGELVTQENAKQIAQKYGIKMDDPPKVTVTKEFKAKMDVEHVINNAKQWNTEKDAKPQKADQQKELKRQQEEEKQKQSPEKTEPQRTEPAKAEPAKTEEPPKKTSMTEGVRNAPIVQQSHNKFMNEDRAKYNAQLQEPNKSNDAQMREANHISTTLAEATAHYTLAQKGDPSRLQTQPVTQRQQGQGITRGGRGPGHA